ncbi:MAG TPA: cell division protein FtsA, partial [Caulobacteraceae bacterium]|nr:cell division protein FtsA [Caulobacteraceae bacterium]
MSRLEDLRQARDGLKVLTTGRQQLVAAVDLGASKVSCFIMRPDGVNRSGRTLQTAGVGYVQSRGVRAGVIVDPEQAVEAIAQAVERAEAIAGVSVSGVTVATAGQLQSCRVSSSVSLGARPIVEADCARAIGAAVAQVRQPGRRQIHLLPVSWSVDAQKNVRDPRTMFGRVLGLELLVVSINEAAFNTLGHCIERAHLQFEGAVAAPFCSALSALEDDEMELGSICVDMGGGSTSVAVFSNGAMIHVDS